MLIIQIQLIREVWTYLQCCTLASGRTNSYEEDVLKLKTKTWFKVPNSYYLSISSHVYCHGVLAQDTELLRCSG